MSAADIDSKDLFEGFRQEGADDLFQITREQYAADRDGTTRGTANPSVMNKPFWLFQVGPGGVPAWKARTTFGDTEDDSEDWDLPVWCFVRFGATRTELPDGRVVCIGGEHEDGYDQDFCIYNDVVVIDAPQNSDPPPLLTPESIKIYGYPPSIFPPTDFHTSTYLADPATGKESIIIVGGLGYAGQASRDRTDVHQLDLTDFSIRRLDTPGAGPAGGTCRHKAELVGEGGYAAIKIMTEEVKELVATGGGGEAAMMERSGEAAETGESVSDGESGESDTALEGEKELLTREESKVFTLRTRDMRWI